MTFRILVWGTIVFSSISPVWAQQIQSQSQDHQQGQNQSGKPIELPPVTVTAPNKKKPAPKTVKTNVAPKRGPSQAAAVSQTQTPSEQTASQTAAQAATLNAVRDTILYKAGSNTYTLDQSAIASLPQGQNAPLDKVLLQAPGIYQDSAASGSLHIRNEHANLQYRIDGIMLPDGVAGFGQVLETSLVGNLQVVTGILPAQYGFRTAGLVDIQTRTLSTTPFNEVSVYGGSHGTFTSNVQTGGISGNTEYFFTGRFSESNLGIENTTASTNAIHDHTDQERYFGYVSSLLPNTARWTFMTGGFVGQYQIPNNPGQQTFVDPSLLPAPLNTMTFNSSNMNEHQLEQSYFNVLAFQQTVGNVAYQVSYYNRFSSLHFTPDYYNDIAFNGIASDVTRRSFLNGVQTDGAWRVSADHTLRGGLTVSAEQTYVANASTTIDNNNDLVSITDSNSKTGWLAGLYLQDEWKLTDKLTLNSGLRFDQMWQYVDANQLSPRISLVYKPFTSTDMHIGYARYFTPPPQAVGAPENYALFNNTVAAAEVAQGSPVLPERSHYFDAGVTQRLLPGLEIGVDAYYKIAKDLLDDGQFGQAYTLTAFNYAKGENEGLELKVKYTQKHLVVYGNLAWARQVGTQVVSNQYLISQDDYNYAQTHSIPTDHSQTLTASAGIAYEFMESTKASLDMIYGSGLRNGDYNSTHLPGYTQFNVGLAHEFTSPDWKPFTVRFDVVNVFDHVYELRDGSGIGVFAPQYGPRRGFFVGLSQKF